ncbi:MAG: sulfatase-like hydrolase/transferase [Pyrobaculum arsenaticum]|uniref:Sulfatase n=1 Tax=Pyrobaculum arsenaticum (strain DSM 13514 / JCM 11321 / PZ6) TaxID=340102 RepID=A4WHU2_PYRAR|nr:sulfatase-like hydrolase/transferase [Pyrobaculum arsenaticum]ABP49959.1 sulfatase [Pyrobaculum arsenaticum DSM 13514]MCY0891532.1 sulfatase-like hydrolase/transferase [Pyrobaculum arsenaticum]
MRKYNVVLIVLDTLRADHAQGLDKLLDLGFVKYEDVYATAPWTLPSHASMFTGMYPSEHGIHETREYQLDVAKIARLRMAKLNGGILGQLKEEGYNTYLISANPIVSSNFGFNADYEYIIDPIYTLLITSIDIILDKIYAESGSRAKVLSKLIEERRLDMLLHGIKIFVERRIRVIPKYLSEKATRNKGGGKIVGLLGRLKLETPFFLFVNIMEAHDPYNKPLVDRRRLKYIGKWLATGLIDPEAVRLWRNYPAHAEEAVKRALEAVETLKARGYWDDTLIIATSDHGELLGDGGLYHIYSLLDGNLRVPLYVKYPGKPKKQRGPITLADVPRLIDPSAEEVGRPLVMAETFGISSPPKALGIEPEERFFHHKIRVIGRKLDFIYDATAGVVERVFRGDKEDAARLLEDAGAKLGGRSI